ncbi:MAG TPA: Uma2 family endonuclease [Bacilli bacterium]
MMNDNSNNKNKGKKKEYVREQPESYGEFERYEIIDHVRYELQPAPTVTHQKILSFLHHTLYKTCHLNGIILFAPVDVYLDEGNLLQPDLIFITNDNMHIAKEARIEGAPDLVAEILSPSTSQNDKIRKKAQYERFGVKEYWVVDPVHHTVDQFLLDSGKYFLYATLGEGDVLTSTEFPCISISMSELFGIV